MRSTQRSTEARVTGAPATRVVAIDRHACGLPIALTDRPLDDLRVNWARMGLANRVSRSHRRRFLLVRRHDRTDIIQTNDVILAWLPADLRTGDLLSLPDRLA